ncbi:MAG: hypothetical protein WCB12_24245 [Bryobacteraceae bacterium]
MQRKDVIDLVEKWRPGMKVVRVEYRAQKADYGQPGFGRMLLRKSRA